MFLFIFLVFLSLPAILAQDLAFYMISWPPISYCDHNTFGGLEYILLQQAMEHANTTSSISVICTTFLQVQDIIFFPNTVSIFASITILEERLRFLPYSYPTLNSAIALAVRYERTAWLFFRGISLSSFFLMVIFFPILNSVITWVLEDFTFSLLTHLADILSSFFYAIEGHLKSTSAKLLRMASMIGSFVFISVYLAILIPSYNNERTYGGLSTPGALYEFKANCHYKYSNLLLKRGIVTWPTAYDSFTELFDAFETQQINNMLHDKEVLEVIASSICSVYIIDENVYKVQFASWYAASSNASLQRQWNEAIAYASEKYTDKTLLELSYQSIPENFTEKCTNKKVIDMEDYDHSHFYELWIFYGSCVNLAVFIFLIELFIKWIYVKKGKFVGINKIQSNKEVKVVKPILTQLTIETTASLLMIKLFARERKRKLKKNKRFANALQSKILKTKKKKIVSRVLLTSGIKKLRILSISLLFCSIFKRGKEIKQLIFKKMIQNYLKSKKKIPSTRHLDTLVSYMILDKFLELCFQFNLVKKRLTCIEIKEYIPNYFTVRLRYSTTTKMYYYSINQLTRFQQMTQTKVLLYSQNILQKSKKVDPKLVQSKLEEIFTKFSKKPDVPPLITMCFMKIQLSHLISKHMQNKWVKQSRSALKNNFINNVISIDPIPYSNLKFNHQKSLKILTQQLIFEKTNIKKVNSTVVVEAPNSIQYTISCSEDKRALSGQIPSLSQNKINFLRDDSKKCDENLSLFKIKKQSNPQKWLNLNQLKPKIIQKSNLKEIEEQKVDFEVEKSNKNDYKIEDSLGSKKIKPKNDNEFSFQNDQQNYKQGAQQLFQIEFQFRFF